MYLEESQTNITRLRDDLIANVVNKTEQAVSNNKQVCKKEIERD